MSDQDILSQEARSAINRYLLGVFVKLGVANFAFLAALFAFLYVTLPTQVTHEVTQEVQADFNRRMEISQHAPIK